MPVGGRSLFLTAAITFVSHTVWAQDLYDAETLPDGVGVLGVSGAFIDSSDRFGSRWAFLSRESAIADYDQLDLAKVLAGSDARAALIQDFLGGLGTTNFQVSQSSITTKFTLAYGITSRLSVAAVVPVTHTTFRFDSWLTQAVDSRTGAPMEPSHYRVRDSSGIRCPKGELDVSDPEDLLNRVVEDGGDDYRFNIGDLRRALTSECLGYVDPVDQIEVGADGLIHGRGARNYDGINDIFFGAKYKFWHGRHLRLSALMFLVLPTGKPDNPDDLFDAPMGDGQWDLGAMLAATAIWGRVTLSLSTGFKAELPDTQTQRWYRLAFAPELEMRLANNEISEQELYREHLDEGFRTPLVTAYEKGVVQRNLGDNLYLNWAFAYRLSDWFGMRLLVEYTHGFRNELVDTGTRIVDGTRLQDSAQIREEIEAKITSGELAAEQRATVLSARLQQSAERKAAAYAWHSDIDVLVARLSFAFTTEAAYLRNEFPFPFSVSVFGALPFAGKNTGIADSFGVSLDVPFAFAKVEDPVRYGFDEDEGHGLPWP